MVHLTIKDLYLIYSIKLKTYTSSVDQIDLLLFILVQEEITGACIVHVVVFNTLDNKLPCIPEMLNLFNYVMVYY